MSTLQNHKMACARHGLSQVAWTREECVNERASERACVCFVKKKACTEESLNHVPSWHYLAMASKQKCIVSVSHRVVGHTAHSRPAQKPLLVCAIFASVCNMLINARWLCFTGCTRARVYGSHSVNPRASNAAIKWLKFAYLVSDSDDKSSGKRFR